MYQLYDKRAEVPAKYIAVHRCGLRLTSNKPVYRTHHIFPSIYRINSPADTGLISSDLKIIFVNWHQVFAPFGCITVSLFSQGTNLHRWCQGQLKKAKHYFWEQQAGMRMRPFRQLSIFSGSQILEPELPFPQYQCYFTSWSRYRDAWMYLPSNVDPFLCTTIVYAFAQILDDRVAFYDWKDEGKKGYMSYNA